MKRIIFLFAILVTVVAGLNAQIINMNPDPNGPVWASGGLRAPVSSTSSYWNYIELIPTAASYAKPLPDFIYNDTLPY